MVPLWMSCGAYQRYVRAGRTPTLAERGFWPLEHGKQVAAQAVAAFRS